MFDVTQITNSSTLNACFTCSIYFLPFYSRIKFSQAIQQIQFTRIPRALPSLRLVSSVGWIPSLSELSSAGLLSLSSSLVSKLASHRYTKSTIPPCIKLSVKAKRKFE